MAFAPTETRRRIGRIVGHSRTRKITVWTVAVIATIGVLALAAPPLLKNTIAAKLSEALHREVTIEQIRLNPYALSATVRGFSMKDRQASGPALSFEELYVNLEALSLFYRGPVVKDLRVVKPYVSVIRNEDRTYNFTDLIEEFTKGPPGPTPRFSLSNIEVVDGRIDFDDRPEGVKHALTSIRVGLPFLSSLPYHSEIKIQPAFSALVNGARFGAEGEATPFRDPPESTVHLEFGEIQIPKYVEYSPVELKVKVPSGSLGGNLTARFRSARNKPELMISGQLRIENLRVEQADATPVLTLPALELVLEEFEIFAGRATLTSVTARQPEIHLTRRRDGTLNLASLGSRASGAPEAGAGENKTPFRFTVGRIAVDGATLHLEDQVPARPVRKRLEELQIRITGLSSEPESKARTEMSFVTDAKERFTHSGGLQLAPLIVDGTFRLEGFQLPALRPYYETLLAAEIRQGILELSGHFAFEANGAEVAAKVSDLNATLRALRLQTPGEAEPLWRLGLLSLKDASIDLGSRTIAVASVAARDGSGFLERGPDGSLNYARLIRSHGADVSAAGAATASPWKLQARRIDLNRMRVTFEDRTVTPYTRIVFSDLSARADNVSNSRNAAAKLAARGRINEVGSLSVAGTAGVDPLAGKLDVKIEGVNLAALQPYLDRHLNLILTRAVIGTQGTLSFSSNDPRSPLQIAYGGSVRLADFAAIEKDGSQDLLKWETMALNGLRLSLQPLQVRVDEIELSNFYSRLILGADGKTNLQKLVIHKDEPAVSGEEKSQAEVAPEGSAGTPLTIGRVDLKGGHVQFSDFYVKPNYTANLTALRGTISELRAEAPGDLEVEASLDHAAPVLIRGKVNPLSKDLYLDILAEAREIELSPFSPYSGKYIGYGIEKGKLSFNVKYRVENRKLEAQNQIILNQLTFGEKIDSPGATKLPVQLAVALLKDRNGVIDVQLPVGGSLDDPEFSVGGIVLRLILNIISRAVTSPFALLGAAFGGGAELSTVEFDYGRAALAPPALARVKALASAMNNRPALKLEIIGRFDPERDLEGLRRAVLEDKVRAQKVKELLRQGNAPASVENVRVEANEYDRYLKAAYGEERFPKPRNFIGLAKDLPRAEMEALMLKHIQPTETDLRALARRRAQGVRDALLAHGVAADRLFIVAASTTASGGREPSGSRASRVDFALK